MAKGRLQVSMLGSFEMQFDGKPLLLKKRLTSKPMVLLQLLLENREVGVTRRAVLEALFGSDAEIDADNSLNATVSQLRRLLRETGLPEENYIHFRLNRYYFESSFSVGIDTEEVAELRRAADLMSGENRVHVLYRLCDLFRGRFLPELDGESWVEVARANYQRIYKDSLTEVCRALEQQRAYGELYRLSGYAASLFPFDEWQVWQQKALLAQGHLREAHALYKAVEKLYISELDAPPPEHMHVRLSKPDRAAWRAEGTPESVAQWLEREKPDRGKADHEKADRAVCVPYPSFLYVYHVLKQAQRAAGLSLSYRLFTLEKVYGKLPLKERDYQLSMEKLEEVLLECLRPEDVLVRSSVSQYLVIFVGSAEAPDPDVLCRRAEELFRERVTTAKVRLTIAPVENP